VATGPTGGLPPARHVLLVAAGGTVGASARVGLSEVFPVLPAGLPWTTLAENVSGAFALAFVLTLLAERVPASPQVQLAVGTGTLGAFTTYSTLAEEVVARLGDGHVLLATGYGTASLLAGLVAAVAGVWAARWWTSARRGRA
jgi:fluoride exporter